MSDLWCVHVQGPDDLYAAPSKEAAERAAVEYQHKWDVQGVTDPKVTFAVVKWPHSAEAHAKDLKLWDKWFDVVPDQTTGDP